MSIIEVEKKYNVVVKDKVTTVTSIGVQGPPGPPGADGPVGPAGIFNWLGVWDIGTAYVLNDSVEYDGTSYVSLTSNTGSQPDISPIDWDLTAAAGADGEGVVVGGTTGQVLTKVDATDFNTNWQTPDHATLTNIGSNTHADIDSFILGHNHTLADVTDSGTIASQDADSVAITGGTAILSSVQLSGGGGSVGTLSWNTNEETIDLIQNGAVLQLGQETHVHVRNNSGSTIPDGTPVMAVGTVGASGRITVAPMDGTNPNNAKLYLGITTESILNTEDGKVTTFGKVNNIDTSGTPYGETWVDGDVIWIDSLTVGDFTNVEPSSSGIGLPIAYVIHANSTVGVLMSRVSNHDEHASASAAQGILADSAVQPLDNVSVLTDDGTYVTSETDPVFIAQKGVANGVATLGADSKIPSVQIPAIAITETSVVVSEAAMLALTAQTGDVAVRTDENESYILQGTDPSILGDWVKLLTPTDAVLSVNTQTGAVVLTTTDIAEGTNEYYTEAKVSANTLVADAIQPLDNVSELTNDAGYLTSFTEINDLSTAVTWANVPDANITQTSVTQHEGALTITTSQISDFGTYANRDATLNTQTGTTYTLVLTDADTKLVEMNNAAANTLTVPPNSSVAFPTGTKIDVVQYGAGETTIVQGSGVTIRTAETLVLDGQYSGATLYKRGTDEWVLIGRLVAA